KPSALKALEEHHAHGRRSARIGGRERDRVRLQRALSLGFPIPAPEQDQRVRRNARLQQHYGALSCGTYLRSCSRAARCSLDTCIWLMPSRRAISDCDICSSNLSDLVASSRGLALAGGRL